MKALLAAVLAAGSLLVVSSCGTPGAEVKVTQSSATPVVAGSTYAWKPIDSDAERGSDPRVSNDDIQQHIIAAVDTALAAKGYRRVTDPAQATLLVSYFLGLSSRSNVQAAHLGPVGPVACGFSGCVDGWGVYGYPTMDVTTMTYTEGTMILDLVDRASGQLAWRATSQRPIVSAEPDQQRINIAVADMTKSLPTGPAG
jgi:hypothetical protein